MTDSSHEKRVRRMAQRVDCRLMKFRSAAAKYNGRPYAVVDSRNICVALDHNLGGAEAAIRAEADMLGVSLPPAWLIVNAA